MYEAAQEVMEGGVLELAPGRLYRLGGTVEADRRISWLPPDRDGREPINAYLLLEGKRAVMIDTGPAVLGDIVVEQLKSLLPQDSVLSVFLTRIEMDCIGNLGRVAEEYRIEAVHAGGASNPFDFFDDLESSAIDTHSARLERIKGDGQLALSDTRTMTVLKTKLRLLSTTWAFDAATGALFTSDSFGHVGIADDSEPPLVTGGERPTVDEVHRHMTSKFDYLHAAETTDIRAWTRELFEHNDVTTIAPSHGCVIVGRELVADHLALVDEALSRCGEGPK
jgi:flavorubredoxin